MISYVSNLDIRNSIFNYQIRYNVQLCINIYIMVIFLGQVRIDLKDYVYCLPQSAVKSIYRSNESFLFMYCKHVITIHSFDMIFRYEDM